MEQGGARSSGLRQGRPRRREQGRSSRAGQGSTPEGAAQEGAVRKIAKADLCETGGLTFLTNGSKYLRT
jgi:hypothetical protein